MQSPQESVDLSEGLAPGDHHYRAFVGPPGDYDLVAAMTFNLLTTLGLRQHHRLLDIGCGSLRVGRLLIPYLNVGNYTGFEPNSWLVEDGRRLETGEDQVRIKRPEFIFSNSPETLGRRDRFDFAVAQSIFSHCGADLLGRWLNASSLCLKPSGALVATAILADKDFKGEGWIYPDCVAYKFQTLEAAAGRAGFDLTRLDWQHPRQSWLLFGRPDFDRSWIDRLGLSWNAMMKFCYGDSAYSHSAE